MLQKFILAFLVTATLSFPSVALGFQAAKDLSGAWENLASRDVDTSTHAIFEFLQNPKQANEFFQEKLRPLSFHPDEFKKLIEELGSDEERVWRSAFRDLSFRDPRIFNRDFMASIDMAPNLNAKRRLVSIVADLKLTDETLTSLDEDSEFRSVGGPFGNFQFGGTTTYIETRIELLATTKHGGARQLEWERTIRALHILKSFDNKSANDLIAIVASGAGSARPTKIAKRLLGQKLPPEHKGGG